MIVLLIGQQGTGKSTLGRALREELGGCFISGGVLIRKEIDAKTEIGLEIEDQIGNGHGIEPRLMYELLRQELDRDGSKPLFLDGFPDAADQEGQLVDTAGKPDHVLLLDQAPNDELVQRLENRLECPLCFATFRRDEVERCPSCETALRQRREDNDRDKILIRHRRWRTYGPEIVSLYRRQGILTQLDARLLPAEVLATARSALRSQT